MSHVPHDLAEEFPEFTDKIHALKSHDRHFASLAARYHAVNRAIHRAETGIEPVADHIEQTMRKHRLALKDEIAALLRTAP